MFYISDRAHTLHSSPVFGRLFLRHFFVVAAEAVGMWESWFSISTFPSPSPGPPDPPSGAAPPEVYACRSGQSVGLQNIPGSSDRRWAAGRRVRHTGLR